MVYNKTSNLVFPDAIVSIDRGSQDIMAQKAFGVENILRVKAVAKSFEETDLSVITKEGHCIHLWFVIIIARPI